MIAAEIGLESVSRDSYFIQVGAFKNILNVQDVVDKLSIYDIYLEPYKDMHRIQVVNIFAPNLKKTLFKIRKIYKKAFIAKRPILEHTQAKAKSFDKKNKPFIPASNNIQMIQHYAPALDSNTILKTRKSFL